MPCRHAAYATLEWPPCYNNAVRFTPATGIMQNQYNMSHGLGSIDYGGRSSKSLLNLYTNIDGREELIFLLIVLLGVFRSLRHLIRVGRALSLDWQSI